MHREILSIQEALDRLKAPGALPERVRYCEGSDQKEADKIVNKRLFASNMELWLEPSVPTAEIQSSIESQGYVVVGNQRVPDGWGTNYDSVYFKLNPGN